MRALQKNVENHTPGENYYRILGGCEMDISVQGKSYWYLFGVSGAELILHPFVKYKNNIKMPLFSNTGYKEGQVVINAQDYFLLYSVENKCVAERV